jgi:hypothetical protein
VRWLANHTCLQPVNTLDRVKQRPKTLFMDPVSLLLASTLSSSVVDLLRRVRLEEGDAGDTFRIRKSGESDTAAALEALPASTREVLESVAAGTADSQDDAGDSGSRGRDRTVDPQQAAAALTLAPQLFADARRRISLMFRLRRSSPATWCTTGDPSSLVGQAVMA